MATVMTRQPFGVVNQARLRNLTNAKNKQNAILPPSTKSLKRSYESDSSASDNDNENIDPVSLPPNKKAKGIDGFTKSGNFMKPLKTTFHLETRPIATLKRSKLATKKAEPISAPIRGRSPQRNRSGILSSHRKGVKPPTFANSSGNGMPFSLEAALAGPVSGTSMAVSSLESSLSHTVTSVSKAAYDLGKSLPANWDFVIYEDSPEEELSNLVQHSTETLDISDDEGRARERSDRGKENVPPADCVALPVARSDIMSEEVRTPLGDLIASDYYAAGLDANSVDVIPADTESTFTFEAPQKIAISDMLKELSGKISKPAAAPVEPTDSSKEIIKSEEPFQIYDTGSDQES